MGLKTKNHSLGRAIIKDKYKGRHPKSKSYRHTTELDDGLNWNSINLKSVTEESTLDEFLTSAELAGVEFTAERVNVTLVTENNCIPTKEELLRTKRYQEENVQLLKIPRRPMWDSNTTGEELDAMERLTFLEWRRSLSMLSEKEGIILTPYEKNLEFWRQLWRVIEKSDVVVQIVDARNPLFFYCRDLNAYVNEMGKYKVNLLLVNKADFLTERQRAYWSDYFTSVNIKIIFWSATNQAEEINYILAPNSDNDSEKSSLEENDGDTEEEDGQEDEDSIIEKGNNDIKIVEKIGKGKISGIVNRVKGVYKYKKNGKSEKNRIANGVKEVCEGSEEEDELDDDDDDDESDDDGSGCGDTNYISKDEKYKVEKIPEEKFKQTGKINEINETGSSSNDFLNKTDIVTVDELIGIFKSFKNPDEPLLTIGLIGYPNVGKSSTINMLLTKRVALSDQAEKSKMYQSSVSTTPGKTKHFQTFFLDRDLMLCDCPGLVMPMFMNAKAEMITNGILSIDHMTDFVPPISIICRCMPKDVLEAFYSVMLPTPPEGEDPNRPPTAYEFLAAYARIRGFMTHKGVPDYQRAARIILKDFVHGRLNYCYAPPTISEEEYESALTLPAVNKLKNKTEPDDRLVAATLRPEAKSELDKEFFKPVNVGFVIKGNLTSIGLKHLNPTENFEKPSKKHFKSNKREKSRRTNSHLDAK